MVISSIELSLTEYYEYSDLRIAKREAKKFAKELNTEVIITQRFEYEEKIVINLYMVYPSGEIVCTDKNRDTRGN
jgi:hypothetical protein